jgi:hypothetical protein
MALQAQMYDRSVKTMLIIRLADYIFIQEIPRNYLEHRRIQTKAVQ